LEISESDTTIAKSVPGSPEKLTFCRILTYSPP
jgi:hypothetical protein